ncbi:flagellar filament capping protein FliD [Caballeronia sp. RCC_10]|uniref:flagellar filament capping protein FliD n=1 Tax=Caballeronia sp. RCC_10 TaxID=3239227 RepID=UPI00352669F2
MTTSSSTSVSSTLSQAAQSIISGVTNSTTDTSTVVAALVSAKTAAQSSTLAYRQSLDNTKLSAIGQLKSSLSALQTALAGLADASAISTLTARSNGNGVTATATTGTVPGSYALDITNVATAQKIVLQTGIGASASVGTGDLSIAVGGSAAMTIAVGSGNNTLAGIASAINSAKDNPGVTATVIAGVDGSHLVLSSNSTGAANTLSVTTNSTDGLGALAFDGSIPNTNYTQQSAAQDAKLKIDGMAVTSPSNTIADAINGVTLSLSAAASNTSQTLSVAVDDDAATKAINGFVAAYNAFVSTASSLSSFDSTASAGSQGGPLLGDPMLDSIKSALATTLAKGVPSGSTTLSLNAIGIDLQTDGTLKLDSDKLSSALSSNRSAVTALFNSTDGVGATLNTTATSFLQTGGVLDTRATELTKDLADITKQSTALQAYADKLTDQYNTQFTALNKLMAQMQSNSQYLTQLFGGEKTAGALATNK